MNIISSLHTIFFLMLVLQLKDKKYMYIRYVYVDCLYMTAVLCHQDNNNNWAFSQWNGQLVYRYRHHYCYHHHYYDSRIVIITTAAHKKEKAQK